MIISVDELRKFVPTDESDQALQFIIEGLESFICSHTNNQFIDRVTKEKNYPSDVKLGLINLVKWDFANRDKLGISSETISRHSVTYSGMSEGDYSGGYPKALTSFLKPYMKARF